MAACTSRAAASTSRFEIELQRDRGRAERARGRDLRHAGDAAEAPLERRRDGRSHRLGAGAGERGVDLDGGEVDARQGRDRQERVRREAREQQRRREQGRSDWAPDERTRDRHRIGARCSRHATRALPKLGTDGEAPHSKRVIWIRSSLSDTRDSSSARGRAFVVRSARRSRRRPFRRRRAAPGRRTFRDPPWRACRLAW